MPQQASVYEKGSAVLLADTKLKVMMEDDYLALTKSLAKSNNLKASKTDASVKNLLLPLLEKEVNEGKEFMALRQMYAAFILSVWLKKKYSEHLLSQLIGDKNITENLELPMIDSRSSQWVYQQYIKTYHRGDQSIQEHTDANTGKTQALKYTTGGVVMQAMISTTSRMPNLSGKKFDEARIVLEEGSGEVLAAWKREIKRLGNSLGHWGGDIEEEVRKIQFMVNFYLRNNVQSKKMDALVTNILFDLGYNTEMTSKADSQAFAKLMEEALVQEADLLDVGNQRKLIYEKLAKKMLLIANNQQEDHPTQEISSEKIQSIRKFFSNLDSSQEFSKEQKIGLITKLKGLDELRSKLGELENEFKNAVGEFNKKDAQFKKDANGRSLRMRYYDINEIMEIKKLISERKKDVDAYLKNLLKELDQYSLNDNKFTAEDRVFLKKIYTALTYDNLDKLRTDFEVLRREEQRLNKDSNNPVLTLPKGLTSLLSSLDKQGKKDQFEAEILKQTPEHQKIIRERIEFSRKIDNLAKQIIFLDELFNTKFEDDQNDPEIQLPKTIVDQVYRTPEQMGVPTILRPPQPPKKTSRAKFAALGGLMFLTLAMLFKEIRSKWEYPGNENPFVDSNSNNDPIIENNGVSTYPSFLMPLTTPNIEPSSKDQAQVGGIDFDARFVDLDVKNKVALYIPQQLSWLMLKDDLALNYRINFNPGINMMEVLGK